MISVLAGIVSICTAILLGFADDVLDLRWRHKLIFPFISAWPLMLIYFIKGCDFVFITLKFQILGNSTAMHLPRFVQYWFNTTYVDFGLLYYVFIIMLIIFCTNAINIIAGINGVEVGQSLVIAISVAIYNIIQVFF